MKIYSVVDTKAKMIHLEPTLLWNKGQTNKTLFGPDLWPFLRHFSSLVIRLLSHLLDRLVIVEAKKLDPLGD